MRTTRHEHEKENKDPQLTSFTKLNIVWHKARNIGHQIKVKLINNDVIAQLTNTQIVIGEQE